MVREWVHAATRTGVQFLPSSTREEQRKMNGEWYVFTASDTEKGGETAQQRSKDTNAMRCTAPSICSYAQCAWRSQCYTASS